METFEESVLEAVACRSAFEWGGGGCDKKNLPTGLIEDSQS